ncbi:MAG TPA: alpha/beta fold hydrolase [Solirubrobacteraceae bacterium]
MQPPALDGVTHRTVSARGLDFHVAEAGAGEPIVLLHGWPQHWWAWRRVVPLLAPHGRLVMPDLRGFGWSDAPDDGYDKPNMARDLLAVMDALGLERVRLVAHDWGARIGVLACLEAPERFAAVLALSCPLPIVQLSPRQLLEVWRFAYQLVFSAPAVGERVLSNPGFIRWLLRAGSATSGVWTAEDLDVYAAVIAEPARARASVHLYRTFLLREARRSPGGRLHVPACLMTGERDSAVPPVLIEGSERGADALAVETVPGAGHFLPEERPELVARRARELFERSG